MTRREFLHYTGGAFAGAALGSWSTATWGLAAGEAPLERYPIDPDVTTLDRMIAFPKRVPGLAKANSTRSPGTRNSAMATGLSARACR